MKGEENFNVGQFRSHMCDIKDCLFPEILTKSLFLVDILSFLDILLNKLSNKLP